jgi:hypothetical protein
VAKAKKPRKKLNAAKASAAKVNAAKTKKPKKVNAAKAKPRKKVNAAKVSVAVRTKPCFNLARKNPGLWGFFSPNEVYPGNRLM